MLRENQTTIFCNECNTNQIGFPKPIRSFEERHLIGQRSIPNGVTLIGAGANKRELLNLVFTTKSTWNSVPLNVG